jgi:hypothetical protein
MRKLEIESWALTVIEKAESGQPVEDVFVELKSNWPIEANKAARRIAGHANAARGEPILWLIGVDQGTGMIGVRDEELANWWPKIQAEFEGVTPELREVNISWKGKSVVALLFETDRAPFIVKNPAYGQTGAGPVQREVPWRDGTGVRTATMNDLILMLSPLQRVPGYDLLNCHLEASEIQLDSRDPIHQRWKLNLSIYMYPKTNLPTVIPAHRCEASFEIPGSVEQTEFFMIRFPVYHGEGWPSPDTEGVIRSPGTLHLEAQVDLLPPLEVDPIDAHIKVKLHPADANHAVVIEQTLHPSHAKRGTGGGWQLVNHPSLDRLGPYLRMDER